MPRATPLASTCQVRERQVAAVHAWACILGIELELRAHPGSVELGSAITPLSAQLVVGMDLDPASNEDLRSVVAQASSLASPLHLPCISRSSPVHLPCISLASP